MERRRQGRRRSEEECVRASWPASGLSLTSIVGTPGHSKIRNISVHITWVVRVFSADVLNVDDDDDDNVKHDSAVRVFVFVAN